MSPNRKVYPDVVVCLDIDVWLVSSCLFVSGRPVVLFRCVFGALSTIAGVVIVISTTEKKKWPPLRAERGSAQVDALPPGAWPARISCAGSHLVGLPTTTTST